MCRVEAIHQRMEIQADVVRRKGRLGRRRGRLSTEWQLWLLDPLRIKLGPVYLTSTGQSEKCQPSCLNLGSLVTKGPCYCTCRRARSTCAHTVHVSLS